MYISIARIFVTNKQKYGQDSSTTKNFPSLNPNSNKGEKHFQALARLAMTWQGERERERGWGRGRQIERERDLPVS